jgi:hypothetical protein
MFVHRRSNRPSLPIIIIISKINYSDWRVLTIPHATYASSCWKSRKDWSFLLEFCEVSRPRLLVENLRFHKFVQSLNSGVRVSRTDAFEIIHQGPACVPSRWGLKVEISLKKVADWENIKMLRPPCFRNEAMEDLEGGNLWRKLGVLRCLRLTPIHFYTESVLSSRAQNLLPLELLS